uniref:Farnesyl pyrophosphate synthase n=1 Tax=Clastoptera arizonana TaxID=38151 RepID=A0A1B6E8U3_9HEMI
MIPSFRALFWNISKQCDKRVNFYSVAHNSCNNLHSLDDINSFHKSFFLLNERKNRQIQHRRGLGSSLSSPIGKAVSKDERREFMAIFPDIVRDLTESGKILDVPDVTKWYSRLLQYNVPGGKKNRGLAMVLGYKMFAKPELQTPEHIRKVHIMAWCIEMLQAFFLVLDDMIDQSETRRGRLCWYKNPEVGLSAVNDGIFIESGIYQLMKKHFLNEPYYFDAIDMFHDVTHKTIMGQSLDNITALSIPKYKLDKFSMDRYNNIVKFKTSYYSFHLPIALAMYMANITDPEKHRQAKTILLQMGNFFQVQDDYLDCFGDPDVTGKIGTDIQDGKCSWLAVVALQRCTPQQRVVMEECYGSKDPEKVAKVKELYNQLSLPQLFTTYEEDSYHLIVTHIQQLSAGLKHDLFFKLLNKIYQREN